MSCIILFSAPSASRVTPSSFASKFTQLPRAAASGPVINICLMLKQYCRECACSATGLHCQDDELDQPPDGLAQTVCVGSLPLSQPKHSSLLL